MAMSKGKVMAGLAGGLFVVSAGVLGYLMYDSYSTRTEMEEELDNQKSTFGRYYQAAVFPSRKSIDSVVSNKTGYAEWLNFAEDFASRGDKPVSRDETPASFKQRLSQEVRRLGRLPGSAEGYIAAPGFMFGFDRYLDPERGVLPEASAVQRLAAQLDAVAHLMDVFSNEGVMEVKEIKCVEPAADDAEEGGRRPPQKKRRGEKDVGEKPQPTSLDYQLSFMLRPAAFVKVLNAITSDRRFMVVKAFAFKSSADVISDRINSVEAAAAKKDSAGSGGRRSRRGRRALVEETQEEETPKTEDRLVVDPELDAPLAVDMTISVYDFGRVGNAAADASAPAAGKEAK